MRQQPAGRSWVSRLARIAFALTTVVVIPFAATQRMIGPRRPLTHPDPRLLQFNQELERLQTSPPTATPDWPPLDPPINLRHGPLRPPLFIDQDFLEPAPYIIEPAPARKRE